MTKEIVTATQVLQGCSQSSWNADPDATRAFLYATEKALGLTSSPFAFYSLQIANMTQILVSTSIYSSSRDRFTGIATALSITFQVIFITEEVLGDNKNASIAYLQIKSKLASSTYQAALQSNLESSSSSLLSSGVILAQPVAVSPSYSYVVMHSSYPTSRPTGQPSSQPSTQPTSSPTVKQCPAGFMHDAIDPRCSICPIGYFAPFDSVTCFPCSEGHFSDREGSGSCNKCPIGQYAPSSASFSCFSCVWPYTTLESGSTECSSYCLNADSKIMDLCGFSVLGLYFVFLLFGSGRNFFAIIIFTLLPSIDVLTDLYYILTTKFANLWLLLACIFFLILPNVMLMKRLYYQKYKDRSNSLFPNIDVCFPPIIYSWSENVFFWLGGGRREGEDPSGSGVSDVSKFEFNLILCNICFPALPRPWWYGRGQQNCDLTTTFFWQHNNPVFLICFVLEWTICIALQLVSFIFWLVLFVSWAPGILFFYVFWALLCTFLNLAKIMSLQKIYDFWLEVWLGNLKEKITALANFFPSLIFSLCNDKNQVNVQRVTFNESVMEQFFCETVFQLMIQITNNSLANSWSNVAILSITVSLYTFLNTLLFYFFEYGKYRASNKDFQIAHDVGFFAVFLGDSGNVIYTRGPLFIKYLNKFCVLALRAIRWVLCMTESIEATESPAYFTLNIIAWMYYVRRSKGVAVPEGIIYELGEKLAQHKRFTTKTDLSNWKEVGAGGSIMEVLIKNELHICGNDLKIKKFAKALKYFYFRAKENVIGNVGEDDEYGEGYLYDDENDDVSVNGGAGSIPSGHVSNNDHGNGNGHEATTLNNSSVQKNNNDVGSMELGRDTNGYSALYPTNNETLSGVSPFELRRQLIQEFKICLKGEYLPDAAIEDLVNRLIENKIYNYKVLTLTVIDTLPSNKFDEADKFYIRKLHKKKKRLSCIMQ